MEGIKVMTNTKKCYECKQDFLKDSLVAYCSAAATTSHWYCPSCLQKKQERDRFSEKVCSIFGIKKPTPQIWTERKRLQNKYGYTDNVIIDCLEYIYHIKGYKVLKESLCLVTPTMIDEMMAYKRENMIKGSTFARAMEMNATEYIVPAQGIKENKHELLDPEDFLDD